MGEGNELYKESNKIEIYKYLLKFGGRFTFTSDYSDIEVEFESPVYITEDSFVQLIELCKNKGYEIGIQKMKIGP